MDKKDYICVKQVLIDDDNEDFCERYRIYFQIWKIYTFSKNNKDIRYTFEHSLNIDLDQNYLLSYQEIKDFFLPLEEWRELQINKILENE
jgi:hypothetical protein